MRKKINDLNVLNQKMQSSHRQLGRFTGQGLHELPLFAAACHAAQETIEMLDFSTKAAADLAPAASPHVARQDHVKSAAASDSPPQTELSVLISTEK